MSGADWKQRPEGGGRRAIRLIGLIARRGGRGIARACLYPITAYSQVHDALIISAILLGFGD